MKNLLPVQEIKYLGLIFNSIDKTISLPADKIAKVMSLCQKMVKKACFSIQELAECIGYLVSVCPAVSYGPLYIRQLEIEKTRALIKNLGNFSSPMQLSGSAKEDLKLWINANHLHPVSINTDRYCQVITTDASLSGWGGCCERETRGF